MKVGFTGSRKGMSVRQHEVLLVQLHVLGATQFHHGDCVGSDQQAHAVAKSLGVCTVGHPPTSRGLRAFCECDEMREPQPFLARDHAIVQSTEFLIGTPDGPEKLRSGTWTTLRYARRLVLPSIIIATDGTLIPNLRGNSGGQRLAERIAAETVEAERR